ncbi:unnamed protein product [Amoebophrya sp. A120]|nr:unnamed protein product [Amoebophrya sp. A120]|eukprot:GSA120T00010034001.1
MPSGDHERGSLPRPLKSFALTADGEHEQGEGESLQAAPSATSPLASSFQSLMQGLEKGRDALLQGFAELNAGGGDEDHAQHSPSNYFSKKSIGGDYGLSEGDPIVLATAMRTNPGGASTTTMPASTTKLDLGSTVDQQQAPGRPPGATSLSTKLSTAIGPTPSDLSRHRIPTSITAVCSHARESVVLFEKQGSSSRTSSGSSSTSSSTVPLYWSAPSCMETLHCPATKSRFGEKVEKENSAGFEFIVKKRTSSAERKGISPSNLGGELDFAGDKEKSFQLRDESNGDHQNDSTSRLGYGALALRSRSPDAENEDEGILNNFYPPLTEDVLLSQLPLPEQKQQRLVANATPQKKLPSTSNAVVHQITTSKINPEDHLASNSSKLALSDFPVYHDKSKRKTVVVADNFGSVHEFFLPHHNEVKNPVADKPDPDSSVEIGTDNDFSTTRGFYTGGRIMNFAPKYLKSQEQFSPSSKIKYQKIYKSPDCLYATDATRGLVELDFNKKEVKFLNCVERRSCCRRRGQEAGERTTGVDEQEPIKTGVEGIRMILSEYDIEVEGHLVGPSYLMNSGIKLSFPTGFKCKELLEAKEAVFKIPKAKAEYTTFHDKVCQLLKARAEEALKGVRDSIEQVLDYTRSMQEFLSRASNRAIRDNLEIALQVFAKGSDDYQRAARCIAYLRYTTEELDEEAIQAGEEAKLEAADTIFRTAFDRVMGYGLFSDAGVAMSKLRELVKYSFKDMLNDTDKKLEESLTLIDKYTTNATKFLDQNELMCLTAVAKNITSAIHQKNRTDRVDDKAEKATKTRKQKDADKAAVPAAKRQKNNAGAARIAAAAELAEDEDKHGIKAGDDKMFADFFSDDFAPSPSGKGKSLFASKLLQIKNKTKK